MKSPKPINRAWQDQARERRKERLLSHIKQNPGITTPKLVALFAISEGLSGATVRNYAIELIEAGSVKEEGNTLQAVE